MTKANPRFASFVWPAKSRGMFTSLTSPNGTNAACNVSSVASSERPPTYNTLLSCWGGMAWTMRSLRARVIDGKSALGACRVLRRRRSRRFAVAGGWKVDPSACVCAFLAPGAVARAELSMGKDLDAAAPHPVDSRRAARRARVACVHGSFRHVSD